MPRMPSEAVLAADNRRLRTLLQEQTDDLSRKDARIQQLEELIRSLRHRQFGASSEQSSDEQLRLFMESDVEDADDMSSAPSVPVRGHQRRRNGRPRLSEDLPRVEVIHDLDASQKVCSEHGCALTRIGEETSEQLDYVPATVQVIRHICCKYTCPQCEGHVVTAKKPPQPIPKSVATPALLAWIIVSKYVDALPLYRQSAIFSRIGVEIDRTTMANWMIACGQLVQPLINLLSEQGRTGPLCPQQELHVGQCRRSTGRASGVVPLCPLSQCPDADRPVGRFSRCADGGRL
jgi:transposase